jgi:hypothetical protein
LQWRGHPSVLWRDSCLTRSALPYARLRFGSCSRWPSFLMSQRPPEVSSGLRPFPRSSSQGHRSRACTRALLPHGATTNRASASECVARASRHCLRLRRPVHIPAGAGVCARHLFAIDEQIRSALLRRVGLPPSAVPSQNLWHRNARSTSVGPHPVWHGSVSSDRWRYGRDFWRPLVR